MKMIFLVSCSVYGFITHACQFQQGICSLFLIIVIILNNRSKSCLDSRKSELLHRDDVFVTEEFSFFLGGGGGGEAKLVSPDIWIQTQISNFYALGD